jgi:hypothetical protein
MHSKCLITDVDSVPGFLYHLVACSVAGTLEAAYASKTSGTLPITTQCNNPTRESTSFDM